MEFFKGLTSVLFLYTIAWCLYQFGYKKGAESEEYSRFYAHTKLQHCQELIGAK